MTISSTVRIAGPFTGNGVTTTFPFTYKVFSTADVQVIRLTISTGVETTLTLVTDYNITLNGNQDSNPGGNIVMVTPLLALYKLTATSDIANLQPTDLTNQGGFYPEVITDALDRATIQIQQLADQTDRAIKIPISDGVLDMTTPGTADRASKYFVYDASGKPSVSSGSGTDTALRTDLANASASLAGSRLSGFRQTGTGATARTVDAKLKDTVSVKDFGAVGDGVTNDHAAIQALIVYAESIGGATIFFPPGTYNCVSAIGYLEFYGDNITFDGYGATLLNTNLFVRQSSQNLTVNGLRMLDNRSNSAYNHLNIYGTYFTFIDVTLEKTPTAGGYQGYIQQTSSFGTFRGLKTLGSNGLFVSGHDHTFVGCEIVCLGIISGAGLDDAYAIKAAVSGVANPAQTYNISIVGGSVSGFYDIIGIGTEIGTPSATGDYTSWVKNVTVSGVTAYKCVCLAYIKPGVIADYRNGLVENVLITGCTLLDVEGINYKSAIMIHASKGAKINNVTMSNCVVRARSQELLQAYGIYIKTFGVTDTSSISAININNCQIIDDSYGVDIGVGGAVGYPSSSGVYIERQNIGLFTDIISDISLHNNYFNGTKENGIAFENQPQGPIKFIGNTMLNVGVNNSATYQGIYNITSASDASFYRNVIIPANTQRPVGLATFSAKTEMTSCFIGNAVAGTSLQSSFFTAPNDCYIWKIELLNAAAISQNDADYSTYEFRNFNTGNVLISVTTRLTGGIAIADDSPPVSISSTSFIGNNAYFPKGSVIRFSKSDTGAGRAITNMYAIVHYVTYNT